MLRRAVLVVVAVSLVLAGGCLDALADDPVRSDDGDDAPVVDELDGDDALEIHHLDVGQADATVIFAPNGETMVIDSGDWTADGDRVISFLETRGVERVDHLVATHGHADHIGGHAAVIEHFETQGDGVGAVYDSGVAHTSATYENYLDAVEAHDVTLYQVQSGDEIDFGDADVTVLNPPAGPTGDDVDANSVALRIDYGEVSYLTTGDAGADAESRLVDEHGDTLNVDVSQAGHHGSSTSSSAPFLDAATPSMTIVSSPQDSQYGHPHDEVLRALADRNVETYWTGVHGDVVVATDGESIAVDTEREAPTDADELLAMKPDDASNSPPAAIGLEAASPETTLPATAARALLSAGGGIHY